MKKLSMFVGLALVMLTAGCAKDSTTEINPSIKTTLGVELDQTRTYIGEVDAEGTYPVLWSTGDCVAVNGVAVAVPEQYVGKNYLSLEAEVAADYSLAYPAELIEGDVLTISEVQKFVDSSFAVGSGVMAGYSTTKQIKMKNLYGYLKFTVSDAANVNAVTVETTGGEAISGTYRIDYKSAAIEPLAGKDIIRVTDVVATNGTATVIVAVPAGEYTKGFTVTIKDNNNGIMTKSLKGSGATVEAGVIYKMPTLTYKSTESQILIMNATDLQAFVVAANSEQGYAAWTNEDGEVKLGADIDLKGITLPQITKFSGVFNGQGFALKNWQTSLAFIGELLDGATLKNLVVDKTCALTPDLTSSNTHIGYMVGVCRGLVVGCVNNADMKISGALATGSGTRFGCIVASGYSRIQNCVNNGDIIMNFTDVLEARYIGGIVGYYNPEGGRGQGEVFLRDCVNNGNINVTSTAAPKTTYIGGVLGSTTSSNFNDGDKVTYEGTIARCENRGTISYGFDTLNSGTYANIGGVVGYSQADIDSCTNYGNVSYIIPHENRDVAATRPAVGGVVACTLHSVTNCDNYGGIAANGVWAGGTEGNAGVGANSSGSFGGVVGSAGISNSGRTSVVENCNNYGKLNVRNTCKTGGSTAGYTAGVVAYTLNDVINCHNYGELTINNITKTTCLAGVVGRTMTKASNLSNNAKVTITFEDTPVKDAEIWLAGVAGRATDMEKCHNNGATKVIVNPTEIAIKTIYSAGVVGYVDNHIKGCSLNAPYSLTTDDNLASLRCAGIAGQIKTINTDYTMESCYTTEKASVSLVTKNTKANYIGGIIGLCNDGMKDCVNRAAVNVTISEKNTTTEITYIAGIAGRHVRTMDNCDNYGHIVADMAKSTNKLYSAPIVGHCFAATTVVSNCTNSGNLTITNAGHTANIGKIVGYGPAGYTVTGTTSTGVVTVNGMVLE
jgi:hypothetical protein